MIQHNVEIRVTFDKILEWVEKSIEIDKHVGISTIHRFKIIIISLSFLCLLGDYIYSLVQLIVILLREYH